MGEGTRGEIPKIRDPPLTNPCIRPCFSYTKRLISLVFYSSSFFFFFWGGRGEKTNQSPNIPSLMTCFMCCRQYGVWTINRHQYSNFITLFNQSKSRTAVKLMVIPKCRVTSISKEKHCHRHAKKIIFILSIFYNIFHSVLSKKNGFLHRTELGFQCANL